MGPVGSVSPGDPQLNGRLVGGGLKMLSDWNGLKLPKKYP